MKAHINIIIVCILCILFAGQFAYAQLPRPIRYYPLTNLDYKDIINRKDGVLKRGITYSYPDRFGNVAGAVQFSPDAYVETPDFFAGTTIKDGFTFSFWIYIDEKYSKYTGVYPWQDTDKLYRVFFSYDAKDNCNLLGFYHRRDRAAVDRYTINVSENKLKDWGIWYWDPIDFTNRIGWYQVFLVCKTNMTYLYMFYPNSQMEYALYYMGYQTLGMATNWGLGSITDTSNRYLDDFKVYDQVLTKEQILELHASESLPDGMNEMSYAFDTNKVIQTTNKRLNPGLHFDMASKTPDKELTHQFVFEPVENKPSVFRIRMAYTSLFMGIKSSTEPYVILEGDYGQERLLEWYIEPAGDGYFFVRANLNRDRYLQGIKGEIQITPYSSAQAPYYKWKFRPLKSSYELSQDYFVPKRNYQVIDSYNTIMELLPNCPVSSDVTPLSVADPINPTLMSHYRFQKYKDDSYNIYNGAFTNMAMYPADLNLSNWSNVNLKQRSGNDEPLFYQYIVEKPNPLGRRVVIRPVMAQTMSVYSGNFPTANKVTFTYDKDQKQVEAREWQLFYDGNNPNANRQIATLTPGVYKIKPLADQSYAMHPANYSFDPDTKIELDRFDPSDPTISYWIVEYEVDNNNQPIRDGSFLIRKYHTQDLYLAPDNKDISENAQIYIELLENEADRSFYKWFLEPTGDKTGAFYIENGADKLKYLEYPTGPLKDKSPIRFSYHRPSQEPSTFKWLFEKVSVSPMIETGIYNISMAENHNLHVSEIADSLGSKMVEVTTSKLSKANTTLYNWKIIKNPDLSYYIIVNGSDLYLHANINNQDRKVSVSKFDNKNELAYKWQITPTQEENVYMISLFDETYQGYLHSIGNDVLNDSMLGTGPYIPNQDSCYKFYIHLTE